MKKVIKKSSIKKKQDGTMLENVNIRPAKKPMYGGPEVRAKAQARRDSIREANRQFSERTAKIKGIVDKEGNADMKNYWKAVKKEQSKPDADRYQGMLNKVNARGEVQYEKESPESRRKHCTAGKCAVEAREASGDLRNKKHGGSIKKVAKSGAKVAKSGNWIQKAVNPKHKGFCTPMSKATCTSRRKALAKTFKAIARKRKNK